MLSCRSFVLIFVLPALVTLPLYAEEPAMKREPVVPAGMDFIRSIDVDTFVERTNYHGAGAQSGRIRLRLLDPDVNAFVGLMVAVHHFNDELRTGEGDSFNTSEFMTNWGGVFGVVRGSHLWELDLLGTNLGNRVGFAPAIVGEHKLGKNVDFYHRTEINIYTSDFVFDQDQGFYWMWTKNVGGSVGYRWFTSLHTDRSGPHIGIKLYFESPKIPFIFPSLG